MDWDEDDEIPFYKFVLVGDATVGKTHVLARYIKNCLPRAPGHTIGVEFATRTIPLATGGTVKAQIWDTAGQERYRAITSSHYRRAVGALLVYDVTRMSSFQSCLKWLEELRANAEPDVVIFLVGNKVDLTEDDPSCRQVLHDNAADFAKQQCLLFEEASAVTSHNVRLVFERLAQEVYNRTQTVSRKAAERGVIIISPPGEPQSQSCQAVCSGCVEPKISADQFTVAPGENAKSDAAQVVHDAKNLATAASAKAEPNAEKCLIEFFVDLCGISREDAREYAANLVLKGVDCVEDLNEFEEEREWPVALQCTPIHLKKIKKALLAYSKPSLQPAIVANFAAMFSERVGTVTVNPQVLAPIQGVMDQPLVQLDAATATLTSFIPGIVITVSVAMAFARDLVHTEGPDPHGLTVDEVGAVYLYTAQCLYKQLNEALRSEDRQNCIPYFGYLRLLLSAVDKLPSHSGHVFRGIRKDLSGTYTKNREVYEWAIGSATVNGEVLKNPLFLGSTGDRSLICYRQRCGKDISRYSAYKTEKEVILPPGFLWRVGNAMDIPGSNGLRLFEIDQVTDAPAIS